MDTTSSGNRYLRVDRRGFGSRCPGGRKWKVLQCGLLTPGLVVAALLAALWLVALVALGRADSGSRWVRLLSAPACVVGGIGAVLLVSQAAVVDAVEDGTAVAAGTGRYSTGSRGTATVFSPR